MNARRVRVLIVDDSALVRQILSRELAKDPGIEVIGTAGDPYIARDKILRDKPDVLTLDIEMPRMDGLAFLKKLMLYHPLPIVILSSLAESGTQIALDALEWGAVEVMAKPKCDVAAGVSEIVSQLANTIKAAANAKLRGGRQSAAKACSKQKLRPGQTILRTTDQVVVVGASTGGTKALAEIFTELEADTAGILAVIHMPEGFTHSFASRLNNLCAMDVREAVDGDVIQCGRILLAPGNRHLALERNGAHYRVRVTGGPPVCGHRPSVEVLFQSAARAAGPNALGIILTGMGRDGAQGLRALKDSGATTLAQNEATCVVFGMPREAIACGGASEVLGLQDMARRIKEWASRNVNTPAAI